MNGGADLGGMMGFGPIAPEADEPLFHAPWEARVMGIVVALGASGQWNIDQSRAMRESLPPAEYLSLSYYQIWLKAAIGLMQARGMISEAELEEGRALTPPVPIARTLSASDVAGALTKGAPTERPAASEPLFAVGASVCTINEHPDSHTRLPRYARGKTGHITAVHGCHVYPDANAAGVGEDPQWLYQVRIPARDLWGSRAAAGDAVLLDLWEPYLRPSTT